MKSAITQIVLVVTALSLGGSTVVCAEDHHNQLTLEKALERALANNPSLAAQHQTRAAASAWRDQLGLWPNPEIELESENFGGRDELSGFDGAETNLILSQEFFLGGDLAHRSAVANGELIIADFHLEEATLDLVATTSTAYFALLAAQERADLAADRLDLAHRIEETVSARVEAGKISPVESHRVQIETARARLHANTVERDLEEARIALAACWGATELAEGRLEGRLPTITPAPALSELMPGVANNPRLQISTERIANAERKLALEKAESIPDLTVSLGKRRFEETGDSAWTAGISVPIPIFDHRQGARAATQFEIEAERRHNQALRIELEGELKARLLELKVAADAVDIAREEILKPAQAAMASIEIGFKEGKFGYLDVLNAQHTLFNARETLIENQFQYTLRRIALMRLVADPQGVRQ